MANLKKMSQLELVKYFNNDGVTKYLKSQLTPERESVVINELTSRSCEKAYHGESHAYGPRFITSVELLNGKVLECHIPLSGDNSIESWAPAHVVGLKAAKWLRRINFEFIRYNYHGKPWWATEPTEELERDYWVRCQFGT